MRAQTLQADEIVVVDNNCTDDTVKIAEEMGAKIVRESRQNISASRNAGIRAALHDWIALLDHDDLWHPQKLAAQWQATKVYPQAEIVGCQTTTFSETLPDFENLDESLSPEELYRYLKYKTPADFNRYGLHTSSLLIRRTIFESSGYYGERFPPQEDIEFIFRILKQNASAYVDASLSYYRKHSASTIYKNIEALTAAQILIVEELHRFPDKYMTGAKEFLADLIKQRFINKSYALTRHRQNNGTK